jgi:opacity protein-like surface antigen
MRFPPLFPLVYWFCRPAGSHRWIGRDSFRLRPLLRGGKQNQICKIEQQKRVSRITKRRRLFSDIRQVALRHDAELAGFGEAADHRAALAFLLSKSYNWEHSSELLAAARMSNFSRGLGLALVLAALCPGARTAHAQAAPVPYWTAGSPFGFGGMSSFGPASSTYGNLPGLNFAGSDAGGAANSRYNFANGFFIGSEGGGLSMSGLSPTGALGNFGSFSYQGMQAGYNFQNSPISVYAGFDTMKYDTGIGSPFGSPFDSTSNAQSGYSARAGVEYRPTSNLSLSLGVGFTQQPTDPTALVLPGAHLR